MTSSSLNLFSGAPLSLFGEPQPRKTNGDDHHDYEDGVLYHRNCPELLDHNVPRPGLRFRVPLDVF
jgi:hypothetical protein